MNFPFFLGNNQTLWEESTQLFSEWISPTTQLQTDFSDIIWWKWRSGFKLCVVLVLIFDIFIVRLILINSLSESFSLAPIESIPPLTPHTCTHFQFTLQDFDDWDDVGLNIPKPPNLLRLYRDFDKHAIPSAAQTLVEMEEENTKLVRPIVATYLWIKISFLFFSFYFLFTRSLLVSSWKKN